MSDETSRDEAQNPRVVARKRPINRLDPIFWILDRFIFESLFRPPKKNVAGEYEELDYADTDFLVENLHKHRGILWLNIALAVYMLWHGLAAVFSLGKSELVITGLLAPAVITGGAWYNLTFGGISEKFLGTAMRLTYWMFLAFSLSMTLLVILLCYLTPWPLRVVLVAVYGGLYIASILYDNVDGLKIGLDTTMLRFSRASLNYYQKHGLLTRDETLSETSAPPDQTALFGHYLAMIENNLKQLEEPRDLEVANHLIASSLDQLFKISEFLLPGEKMVDRGGEYESFVKTAYSMPQEEVDQRTIFYLELIIKTLRARLRGRAAVELDAAESTLEEFKRIRAGASVGEGQASAYQPGIPQSLADHLFIQVFHQLVSLIKAHRSLFFRN